MRNKIDILRGYLEDLSPNEVLNSLFHKKLLNNEGILSTNSNRSYIGDSRNHKVYSDEEMELKLSLAFKECKTPHMEIFDMIADLSQNMIHMKGGTPVVRYPYLFHWRDITLFHGEDLFTCAYLAKEDSSDITRRDSFNWNPIISTDNIQLKEMMAKGIAENHYHLKGSGPVFQLNWISLMNHIKGREKDFQLLTKEGRLTSSSTLKFEANYIPFYVEICKAAYIRALLFEWINEPRDATQAMLQDKKSGTYKNVLMMESKEEMGLYLNQVQHRINNLSYRYGRKYENYTPDYCIPNNYPIRRANNGIEDAFENAYYIGNSILAGERKLIYECMIRIFSYNHYRDTDNKEKEDFATLFVVYLMIKSKLRHELVQVNHRVGFKNFAKYQDRKTLFLDGKEYEFYSRALVNLAGVGVLNNEKVESLEARIAPKGTMNALGQAITDNDKAMTSRSFYELEDESYYSVFKSKLDTMRNERIGYCLHYIKLKDFNNSVAWKQHILPRNYRVRQLVKLQTDALLQLRRKRPSIANRIVGIDAANSELVCRPEVFAQAYRALRCTRLSPHSGIIDTPELHDLGITFHAGEDFLGIADGLRAIDETIQFLEYESGDRIGHALALGINPKGYYKSKRYEIVMTKQIELDNCAWILSKYRLHNRTNKYLAQLKKRFEELIREIYADYLTEYGMISSDAYMEAWKLRGDNPNKLLNWDRKGLSLLNEGKSVYSSFPFREEIELDSLRQDKRIVSLYLDYHFNQKARNKGDEPSVLKVEDAYIRMIEELQDMMIEDVSEKHLCIETNPSSNHLIGTFNRYDEHPILRFYNEELEGERGRTFNQLSVSINTDDQGVFSTYLENEYALMALALEKKLDEDGNRQYSNTSIYRYLDRIREMGREQSFLLRNKV